jgi:hypothetical protein
VHDREIGAVASALPPEEAAKFLIHLANLQGGPDNITALVIKIRGESSPSIDRSGVSDPWRGPPVHLQFLGVLKALPWALLAMALAILLGGFAVYLSATEKPGDFIAFVFAGLLLFGGLIGMMLQNLHERNAPPESMETRKLHVYRQIPCPIDQELLDRLGQAMTSLLQRVRDHQWEFDEATYRGHVERGQEHKDKKAWLDAFREHCRAMMILMEAIQQHRGKEEAFRPLWDKARG